MKALFWPVERHELAKHFFVVCHGSLQMNYVNIWYRNTTIFASCHMTNFTVDASSRIWFIGFGLQERHSVVPNAVRLRFSPLWFTMFQKRWQCSTEGTISCWRKFFVSVQRKFQGRSTIIFLFNHLLRLLVVSLGGTFLVFTFPSDPSYWLLVVVLDNI